MSSAYDAWVGTYERSGTKANANIRAMRDLIGADWSAYAGVGQDAQTIASANEQVVNASIDEWRIHKGAWNAGNYQLAAEGMLSLSNRTAATLRQWREATGTEAGFATTVTNAVTATVNTVTSAVSSTVEAVTGATGEVASGIGTAIKVALGIAAIVGIAYAYKAVKA